MPNDLQVNIKVCALHNPDAHPLAIPVGPSLLGSVAPRSIKLNTVIGDCNVNQDDK